jgi:DNA-binding transcriptional MerR regulator
MPVETIRFYESKGIVKPHRSRDNDYRMYETWDAFRLFECIFFKGFNFSLKEVVQHLNEGSHQTVIDKIKDKKRELYEKIKIEKILAETMEQFIRKHETMRFNLGKYWVQKIPENYYFYYCESNGDNYGEIDTHNQLFTQWIKYFPFVNSCQSCTVQNIQDNLIKIKWGLRVKKEYAEALKLPLNKTVINEPEKLCLTTFIDIGAKGELSAGQFEPIVSYAKQNGYKIGGEVFGEGVLRTHENGKACRFMELTLPIKE